MDISSLSLDMSKLSYFTQSKSNGMGKRNVVLKESLIELVKKRYRSDTTRRDKLKHRSGFGFNSQFYQVILDFINTDLKEFNDKLVHFFKEREKTKGVSFSEKTLSRAMDIEYKKASPQLADVLGYYAFGIGWEEVKDNYIELSTERKNDNNPFILEDSQRSGHEKKSSQYEQLIAFFEKDHQPITSVNHSFDFLGVWAFNEYRQTSGLIKADRLSKEDILIVRDQLFDITKTLQPDYDNSRWHTLYFVYEQGCPKRMINYIIRHYIYDATPHVYSMVLWIIDLKNKTVHPHKKLLATSDLFSYVFHDFKALNIRGWGMRNGVHPGLKALKKFLETL